MNKLLLLWILCFVPGLTFAQNDAVLNSKQKTKLVSKVSELLLDNYVLENVAKQMSDHIIKQLKTGAYNKIDDPVAFANTLTLDLYAVYHDKHLLVQYLPESSSIQSLASNNASYQDPNKEIKQANFGFTKTEILPGNIGYIQIEHFWADSVFGKETTKATLQFVANTNAVIIDVRNCGGGSQDAVNLLCSYFFEKSTHINDMYNRAAKTTTQYWTKPDPSFTKMNDKPLYIICNDKTFSAAEEFTYDLQSLKRATIIGETTGGGAHGTFTRDAGNGFSINIPYCAAINPTTKTNWETIGVIPDTAVSDDNALEKTEEIIFEKLITATHDSTEFFNLKWQQDLLKAINHPLALDTNTLKSYAGIYGERVFTYQNGRLYYQRTGRPKFELEAITPTLMKGKGNSYFKIEFLKNNNGIVDRIKAYYQNNTIESAKREINKREHAIADKMIFTHNDGAIPYRLIYPENEIQTERYPLLVYLHGMGTRGKDNEQPYEKFSVFFSDSVTSNKFPCYILIPQCPENDVWVSFPNFPNSLSTSVEPTTAAKTVLALIHQLISTKNIDSNKIYLTGFSMGGEGTFDLLTREPKLFACGVPLASVADTSKASLIKNIPLWVFHGSDDKVNDVKYTRMMIETIRKKGGNPIYSEIKGVGHDCRNAAYMNEKLWKWIFEQHK